MSSVLARLARAGVDLPDRVPPALPPDQLRAPSPRPIVPLIGGLVGRGTAAGYTGAYREPGEVDIEEVVAVLLARGPE